MYDQIVITSIVDQALLKIISHQLSHEDIEDIRQEMYLMAISLKDKLDFEKNWKGFLYISMIGAGLNYLNSRPRNTISISDVNTNQEHTKDEYPDSMYDDVDIIRVVQEFMTQDYKGWGVRYFGLDGYASESFRQIAKREEVSHACVHDYVSKLLDKIRTNYE